MAGEVRRHRPSQRLLVVAEATDSDEERGPPTRKMPQERWHAEDNLIGRAVVGERDSRRVVASRRLGVAKENEVRTARLVEALTPLLPAFVAVRERVVAGKRQLASAEEHPHVVVFQAMLKSLATGRETIPFACEAVALADLTGPSLRRLQAVLEDLEVLDCSPQGELGRLNGWCLCCGGSCVDGRCFAL